MPKYVVTLVETISYEVTLEAENESDAEEGAKEIWCNSAKPGEDFPSMGEGVETADISLAP